MLRRRTRFYCIFVAVWILVLTYCVTFLCLVQYVSKHDDFEQLTRASSTEHEFKFSHFNYTFFATEVLTTYPIKLKERMRCNADAKAPPKLILSWNAGFSQENLGGCRDWNCKLIDDKNKLTEADAVLFSSEASDIKRKSDQYFIYYSQESPVNSKAVMPYRDFYNMSLGFRHDSPTSSPYGYTVKLSKRHRQSKAMVDYVPKQHIEVVNMMRVNGKFKGAAWFVSNCITGSKRELYVKQLQKYFPIDIYGDCGKLECPPKGKCIDDLNEEYHFYIAFENSVCKDYITEKLWNQGYQYDIVPIVLKRSLVEKLAPPNSFIAADDFDTIKDLAGHLHHLMRNKTAYAEYFNWRRDYRVVFLDGGTHDSLERPWGFCQICRLLWEKPRPHFSIRYFEKYWDWTCEKDGELVEKLLKNERKTSRGSFRKLSKV